MKPDPKIRATPRPVRVAYLIEDGPDAHQWLDAIFADCFSRDGGRQSLVVPVVGGLISRRYQDWLRILDPDIAIAVTYDNDALVPELIANLADTTILECQRNRNEPEERPRVGIHDVGLTALSWLPFMNVRRGFLHKAPTFILDCYPQWHDDGLVKDNFGTPYSSLSGFPMHDVIAMRGLMLTPSDAPENRWNFRLPNAEEIPDGYAAIERMTTQGGIVTLAHLSNINCQRYRIEHPWTQAFCLVIGDSLADRIVCWNAALLFNDAQHQPYKTLRVPAPLRTDEARIAAIGRFLQRWNWLGQNNGPARIIVRSNSLSTEDVQDFTARLQHAASSYVTFSSITSLDDCCPESSARVNRVLHMGDLSSPTSETALSETMTIVTVPKPVQLEYSSGMNPIFSTGQWWLDLGIDRLEDNNRFDNHRDTWNLPNRTQLPHLFIEHATTRILRYGQISIQVNAQTPPLEVKQPEDHDFFHGILCDPTQFNYQDLRSRIQLPAAYRWYNISDKGRYLQGMLGMFGSLSNLEHVLSKHFWRQQFKSMATPAQDQHTEVVTYLKRRMRANHGILLINEEAQWGNLADHVIQKATTLRVPREVTRYQRLLDAWQVELGAAIDADPQLQGRRDEILAEAPDDLKESLSFLFEYGVLYRGHRWTCRHCSHRNWVGVEALKNIMICEVCRQDHQLPVDVALDFRLNEFFSTCLREHDTVSVASALCALRQKSNGSFIFSPQTNLFRDYPENQGGRPTRELDLVCVVDGKFVLGEVKAGVELIMQSDLQDLAEVATELRANVAVLAALAGDRALLDSKVAQLQALLPANIEARPLLSAWDDEPSAYL